MLYCVSQVCCFFELLGFRALAVKVGGSDHFLVGGPGSLFFWDFRFGVYGVLGFTAFRV